MWRSYLKIGFRSLAQSRAYTFINIFGLSLGIAPCALILLYVRYEFSYDSWLPHARDTYQLQSWSTDPDTGDRFDLQQSQYVAGTDLKKDFPQIEQVVFAWPVRPAAVVGGQSFLVDNALAVNGPFFDVVALPLVSGNPANALGAVGTAVLSQTEAKRLFGTEQVAGKTLTLLRNDSSVDYRITGVFKDIPSNSHMKADIIYRIDPAAEFAKWPEFLTSWGDISGYNYVRLRPGTDPATIAAAMAAWEKRNAPPDPNDPRHISPGTYQDWPLINVRDVHLSGSDGGMTQGNSRTILIAFVLVAFLVLGMACINFVNLATARAGQRAREVALRKVLGAQRRQLIAQFLGEAMLISVLSTVLGLALAELLLPYVNDLLNTHIRIAYLGRDGILLPAILLALLIGLVSGAYPAFFLSRFQPAQVLKANRSGAETPGSGRLRNLLVVLQFATSIGLIICTSVVYLQTMYARDSDPGFRRHGLIQIALPKTLSKMGEALATEVERVPGVSGAAVTALGIATPSHMSRAVYVPGQAKPIDIGNYAISADFFDTVGLNLLAGRLLDAKRQADVLSVPDSTDSAAEQVLADRGGNVVINAAAAHDLGFRHPADAIGKQVRVDLFMGDNKPKVPVTIVGVVSDARFRSVRERVDDVMYRLGTDYVSTLVVRYDSAHPAQVMDRVSKVLKRLAPEYPVTAQFSEDIVNGLYRADDARARLLGGFAILAVVIGCLGLFGLAAFTAERRTKEIGIRKVLGARTRDIVRLLVWAIHPAGADREPDRLADRLVGDARLAERVRQPHPPRPRAVRRGEPARFRDRDRHRRRARDPHRPDQSRPRPPLRMKGQIQ